MDSDYSEASFKGGCGFAQDMMIHNGQVINYSLGRSSITEFRALCLLNNNLAVIDSKGKVAFGDFVSSLSNLGVQEAIYLDMGDWKHSWYRADKGNAKDIYGNPNKFATNWVTFYKA